MPLPTLDEFITGQWALAKNTYVREAGFRSLYVRLGSRNIDGVTYPRVLDIANVTARKPGRGTFGRLLELLEADYPDVAVYVESVLNPRLLGWLPRHGFVQVPGIEPPSFIRYPRQVH